MRIVSPFKDYYDCIQGVGQDQSLLYVRNPIKVKEKIPSVPHYVSYWKDKEVYSLRKSHTIGFCGKLYCILEFWPDAHAPKFLFNINDVDEYMKFVLKKKELEEYFSTEKGYRYSYIPYEMRRKKLIEFFDKFNKSASSPVYGKYFEEQKCPIFQSTFWNGSKQKEFTWNANLRLVEFFRVFDPFQAFQEISMFLGNMAMPEKEIPQPSDEILAEIKGFDKFSFRKDPTKKK
jgi:hypothetical protein